MLDKIRGLGARFAVAEFAGDVAWSMAFQLCSVVTVAASFMMLGRGLAVEAYGEYVGLFAVTTPLTAIGYAAGLSVVQSTFREGSSADDASARYWAMVLLSGVGLSVVAVIVAVLTLSLGLLEIIAIVISELVVQASIRVLAASQRAQRGVRGQMEVEIVNLVVRFAVLAILFVVDELTVRNLAVGWLVAFDLYLVFLALVWLPRQGRRLRIDNPSRAEAGSIILMGSPIFANNFQTNGDKIVLNAAGLKADAGLYGAAFRVMTLAILPIESIEAALFHRFLESDDDAVGQHTRRALRYSAATLALVVPISAAVWVLAPQFEVLVGSKFGSSVTMIRWLTLWLPFQVLSQPPLNGLLGLGRLSLRLWVVMSSAAISMVFYVALIPGRGWEGAVIGTILSEIYLVAAGWYALTRAQARHDAGVRERRLAGR